MKIENGRGQLFDGEHLVTEVEYELPLKDSGSATEATLRAIDGASLGLLMGAIANNRALTLCLDGRRRWDCLLQRVNPATGIARAIGRGARAIYDSGSA